MLQEIMTQAVVGRAERTLSWCHQLAASDVKQVLGVRIGKSTVEGKWEEGEFLVELTADCDLWCNGEQETKVLRIRSRTIHKLELPLRGEVAGEVTSLTWLIGGPRSTGVRIEGDALHLDLEATIAAEVMGLARLWIEAFL